MSESPYASPQSGMTAVGVLSGQREDLRSVAKYQRGILICILLQGLLFAMRYVVAHNLALMLLLLGTALCVWIAGAVFVFLLAMKVFGQGLGIVFGILALVPCAGLIVLLVVNLKATSILKDNGIRVGLLGADVSSI
jgi:hypothetical protein